MRVGAGALFGRHVPWLLGGFAMLLVAIHCAFGYAVHVEHREELRPLFGLFHLDHERNVPATFSALCLVFSGFLLVTIARGTRARGEASRNWWILGAVFVFLGLDEYFQIHERLSVPMRRIVDTGDALYYAWIVPYGVLTLALGASLLPFLWKLPAKTRALFVVAGTLYVGGAVGLEILQGIYRSDGYLVVVTVEELLELLGVSVFIFALIDYIHAQGLRVDRLTESRGAA